MKEIKIDELLKLAKEFKEKGIHWHHHFFTPKCHFNKSGKYWIVLENEDSSEVYYSEFEEKPMTELEQLENLFFDR